MQLQGGCEICGATLCEHIVDQAKRLVKDGMLAATGQLLSRALVAAWEELKTYREGVVEEGGAFALARHRADCAEQKLRAIRVLVEGEDG